MSENKNHENFIRKYNLSSTLIYSLHESITQDFKSSILCNEFSIDVRPDYGGGLTKSDAENEAKRLHSIISIHPELLQENTALKKKVKELEDFIIEYAGKLEANLQKIREVTNY